MVVRTAAPLRAQAADVLRHAILSLDFSPGQRLVERELIERLGVSRTTVREALRELESEGLVEVIPQRGAVVATVNESDAADLYEARTVIEALMVRRFVERATDADIKNLRAAIEDYAAIAQETADVRQMLVCKDRFYEVLRSGAKSPVLSQMVSGLQGRIRVLRSQSLSQPGRPAQSAAELRSLGSAIEERDAKKAYKLCVAHVRTAAQTELAALEASAADA